MSDILPIWPSLFLPDPSNSFQTALDESTVRTKFDSGATRQRRRYSVDMQSYSVEWEMTDYELSLFRAWHAEKLNFGASWFMLNLPGSGELAAQKVRIINGTFNTEYVPVMNWKVTAKLEVIAPTRIPDGMLDLIFDPQFSADFPGIVSGLNDLYIFTNYTLPPLFQ